MGPPYQEFEPEKVGKRGKSGGASILGGRNQLLVGGGAHMAVKGLTFTLSPNLQLRTDGDDYRCVIQLNTGWQCKVAMMMRRARRCCKSKSCRAGYLTISNDLHRALFGKSESVNGETIRPVRVLKYFILQKCYYFCPTANSTSNIIFQIWHHMHQGKTKVRIFRRPRRWMKWPPSVFRRALDKGKIRASLSVRAFSRVQLYLYLRMAKLYPPDTITHASHWPAFSCIFFHFWLRQDLYKINWYWIPCDCTDTNSNWDRWASGIYIYASGGKCNFLTFS